MQLRLERMGERHERQGCYVLQWEVLLAPRTECGELHAAQTHARVHAIDGFHKYCRGSVQVTHSRFRSHQLLILSSPFSRLFSRRSATSARIDMALSSLVLASAVFSGVALAQDAAAVNQLETARLTQAAQRAEFGVEGDASAFRFSFSDPVSPPCTEIHLSCCSIFNQVASTPAVIRSTVC